MAKKRLGRGLEDLLRKRGGEEREVRELDIGVVFPNRHQPREDFDEEGLQRLADSMKRAGVLQPVVVRPADAGYELVIGERRWRAARRAGLTRIPAVVRDVGEEELLEYALMENVQREDLNPIERAKGYKALMTKFDLKQEEIAERLGVERSTVSNTVRLLDLPEEVQAEIARGRISAGHAKALLTLGTAREQRALAEEIVAKGLSVRDAERAVGMIQERPKKGIGKPSGRRSELVDLERRLMEQVGSRVSIRERQGKGYMRIEFDDMQECQRLVNLLMGVTR